MPSLVDLPPELLETIWTYLDWDRTASLTPSYESRESIFNISLTCNYLRKAVLPTLFRYVPLSLRSDQGVFLVPSLVHISRQRPDLAKHIHCVHIRAENSQKDLVVDKWKALPEDIADPSKLHKTAEASSNWDCREQLLLEHRESVAETLSVFQSESLSAQTCHRQPALSRPHLAPTPFVQPLMAQGTGNGSGDEPPTQFQLRASPQAFWLATTCLNPTVREIVFDGTEFAANGPEVISLAFDLLFVVLEIFKHRLERITMLAQRCSNSYAMDQLFLHYDEKRRQSLSRLQKVTSLTFAASDIPSSFALSSNTATLKSQGCFHWHHASNTVTDLELRNLRIDSPLDDAQGSPLTFLAFVQGFPNLKSLTLTNVALCPSWTLRGYRELRVELWLELLIKLRKSRASLKLRLDNISYDFEEVDRLSTSGVKWLTEEAVPVGTIIDHERAHRLTQDFASFIFLWHMEDSAAGSSAAADPSWEHLVDVAMRNRALGFG